MTAGLALTLLATILDPLTPAAEPEVLAHAVIQLVGSGGLGGLLWLLWTLLKTKLDAINEADVALGTRIDTLDKDIKGLDGRLDNLQAEIARKANSDSVAALEGRLVAIEREGREHSRRLTRIEARAELISPGSSGVAQSPINIPEPR
jgi:hypothetical protein